jgi:hypothetical protein
MFISAAPGCWRYDDGTKSADRGDRCHAPRRLAMLTLRLYPFAMVMLIQFSALTAGHFFQELKK